MTRALAPEPELLLLDEPFSALDTVRKERLELELMSLQQSYKGNMLFVTHDLAQGYKLSSKIAIYDSGRIIQYDSKQKVISSPANRIVARLTGVRNLFKGIIVEVKENYARAMLSELDEKVTIELKGPLNPVPNQSVLIGIRPEYVHLSDNPLKIPLSAWPTGLLKESHLLSFSFICRVKPIPNTASKLHYPGPMGKEFV